METTSAFRAALDTISEQFSVATDVQCRNMLQDLIQFTAHAAYVVHQLHSGEDTCDAAAIPDTSDDFDHSIPGERERSDLPSQKPHTSAKCMWDVLAHIGTDTSETTLEALAHVKDLSEQLPECTESKEVTCRSDSLRILACTDTVPERVKNEDKLRPSESISVLAGENSEVVGVRRRTVQFDRSHGSGVSEAYADGRRSSRNDDDGGKMTKVPSMSRSTLNSVRSSVVSVGECEMMELEQLQKDYRTRDGDLVHMSGDTDDDAEGTGMKIIHSDQSHRCILDPNKRGRMLWDVCGLCFVLLDSVLLPFEMSYQGEKKEGPLYFVGMSFFSCDLVLNFLTGYVDKGILVMDQKRIALNYLQSWFLLDLLSTVPIHMIFSFGEGASNVRLLKVAKLAKLLRLMRLLRLLKLNKLLERIEAYFESVYVIHVVNLIKVLLVIIFFCHWNACLWWAIGHPDSLFFSADEPPEERASHWTVRIREPFGITGGEKFQWIQRPIHESYMFCLYWTLGVMRTMPSEVYPLTFTERLYCMLFMFFAFSLFAACVARITGILSKIGARRAEFDERMAYLRKFMRDIKCPVSLQDNVKQYLEHLFETRRIMASEDELKRVLSEHLTAELNVVKYDDILRREPFFQRMSSALFKRVLNISASHLVSPGDIIVHRMEVPTTAICILSGTVRHFTKRTPSQNDGAAVSRLHTGSWIDVEALLFEGLEKRKANVIAETFSELFLVSKDRFFDLRSKWPALDKHCRRHIKAFFRGNSLVYEPPTQDVIHHHKGSMFKTFFDEMGEDPECSTRLPGAGDCAAVTVSV